MRLHGIEIPVRDMDRAYVFYRDVLGFPVIGRFGDNLSMFFLSDVHGGMAMLVRTDGEREFRGPRLMLTADGIEAVRAELEAKGVTFLGGTDHSPLGATARFLDPEGNELVLFDNAITMRLREQARASNADLVAALGAREQALATALAALSDGEAAARPADGEWPILGHVAHIIDTLDSCGVISRDLAEGREPPRDRLLQRDYAVGTLAGGKAALDRAFSEARRWLHELQSLGDGDARLVHGLFGGLSGREWAAFMLLHISMHTDQIVAIKASR